MVVKLPADLGLSETNAEQYKEYHYDFLLAYDAEDHLERMDGGTLLLEDEDPFK